MFHLLKAPDFVSIINLLFGMAAMHFAFSGAYGVAAACILIAAVLDGVDGYVARKTSGGPLGGHVDSLVDAVSFGVAPAVVVYCMTGSLIAVAFVSFYAICGILRLARYNAFPSKGSGYSGIPITGAGVAVAVFIILSINLDAIGVVIPYIHKILLIFMFILSLLMISTIPYSKVMKKRTFIMLIIVFFGTIASVFVETPYIIICPIILGALMLMYLISPLIGLVGKKKSVEL